MVFGDIATPIPSEAKGVWVGGNRLRPACLYRAHGRRTLATTWASGLPETYLVTGDTGARRNHMLKTASERQCTIEKQPAG